MIRNLLATFVLFAPAMAMAAPEAIYGYSVGPEGVTYQVSSGGCTGKSSFRVLTRETSPVQVVLERVKMDFCEAYYPYGAPVTFSFKELGLSPGVEFRISNPTMTLRVFE